ncbi:MAG TPA: YkvA family protein [Azospirillaceae bacterium]|nr:YkvA family protein [Azospirillaceae bacterium]
MDKDDAARVDPLKFARDEKLVLAKFWTKLRDNLHRVPFVEDAVAAFYAATDAATPLKSKAVLLGALAYFIMPFDAVPDVLALVGFSDDLAVLALAIRTVKGHLRAEHYEKARAWLVSHRTGPARAEDIHAGPIIDHEPRPSA